MSQHVDIAALAARIRARSTALKSQQEGDWAASALDEALKNCGTGAGGFQEGNTCARGGGGTGESPSDKPVYFYQKRVSTDDLEAGDVISGADGTRATYSTGTVASLNKFAFYEVIKINDKSVRVKNLETGEKVNLSKSNWHGTAAASVSRLNPQFWEDHPDVAEQLGKRPQQKSSEKSTELSVVKSLVLHELKRLKTDVYKNCGTGAGGFQEGNTCSHAGGGGAGQEQSSTPGGDHSVKDWVDPPAPRGKLGSGQKAGGYSSDRAAGTNTQLGREGEKLFAEHTGGEILHPPGKGEQSPLDVVVHGVGYEVKAVSVDATSFKATPKPHEIEQKLKFAEELGVKPALAIVIIDRAGGQAYIYRRMGLQGGRLSSKTGWEHLGIISFNSKKGLKMRVLEKMLQAPPMSREDWMIVSSMKTHGGFSYASTQVNLPAPLAEMVKRAARLLPEDIIETYEDTPHVTVKYGIEDDGADAELEALIARHPPLLMTFGIVDCFPATQTGADNDVIIIRVDSAGLDDLHNQIGQAVKVVHTFPYHPHVTLAYVKAGEGARFRAMDNELTGRHWVARNVLFSDRAGKTVELRLRGDSGGT